MLTPIEKLTPIAPLNPDKNVQKTSAGEGESMFGSIFRSAINDVKETDAEYREAQYLLATGQLDNPAMAMIAGTKNGIAVDFLIQLRNKVQEAYSELTRMTV